MATIFGNSGSNILWDEGNMADVIAGNGGNDILLGLGGDDALAGGTGNDKLFGGTGNDELNGGSGKDAMTGGEGIDTFVFSGKTNADVITDFDLDNDILQIKASKTIKTVNDVIKNAKETKGGDLVIDLGKGNKITLKNVSKDDFKQDPDSHIVIT